MKNELVVAELGKSMIIDNVVIREAEYEDEENIRNFIHLYWRRDHPLSKNKELFDFQHKDTIHSRCNFVLAEDVKSKDLYGILGFIPVSLYDKLLIKENDYWATLFMVCAEQRKNGLGKSIWDFFVKAYNCSSIGGIGASEFGLRFFERNGLLSGTLNHYYLLNKSLVKFRIASGVSHKEKQENVVDEQWKIEHINDLPVSGIDISSAYRPLKTVEFLRNRYNKHPFYHYSYLLVKCNKKLVAILVIRKITLNSSCVLRIVDCVGTLEGLPCLVSEFQKILDKEMAEYIDCLNFGIDESTFVRIGFNLLKIDEPTIIPNYFEPFEKKNKQIKFAYRSPFPYVIFKGDSDQDRPNILLLCKKI